MIRRPQHAPAAARHARRAFTLLEVLVVVAIIVMLAGLGGYLIIQRYQDAQVSTAKIKSKDIAAKVEAFYVNNGDYPPNIQALMLPQPNGGNPLCTEEALMDPWGKPFQIATPTDAAGNIRVEVFTLSPRGQRISNLGH
jgi:general secretion pathway protein G